MSILVYAYGCAQPTHGLDFAMAEQARCIKMWNELVDIDRSFADKELSQARQDDPDLDDICDTIELLTEHLKEHPDDKETRQARRLKFRVRNEAHMKWRKSNKKFIKQLNDERVAVVKLCRQQHDTSSLDPISWHNYNRVLRSYDTGRQVAARRGRLIRPYDITRDDGILAIQIQKTRSGFGASPDEIQKGDVSFLQISKGSSYSRADTLRMRCDAAGHVLELPIFLHRPFPPKSRIKAAELVWRRVGIRLQWRACFTLDVSESGLYAPMRNATTPTPVAFLWQNQGQLDVMRTHERIWSLPVQWMNRVNGLEEAQSWLDTLLGEGKKRWSGDQMGLALSLPTWKERLQALDSARRQLDADQLKWLADARRLFLSIPGQRQHILGARREFYRMWARELVRLYPTLQVSDIDLSIVAKADEGTESNRWRQRAAVHVLRQEIEHQAKKAGTPLVDSDGRQTNLPSGRVGTWKKRKDAKAASGTSAVTGEEQKTSAAA